MPLPENIPPVENDEKNRLQQIYKKEVSKYKLLTADEEKALSRRAQRGDISVRNLLISSNLRLVGDIARRLANKFKLNEGLLSDLIQEGNLGLMKAVEKFKPEKGFRFSTYAINWIRAYIMSYLNIKLGPVRPSKKSGKTQPLNFQATDAPISSNEDSPTFGDNLKSDTLSPEEATQKHEVAKYVREATDNITDKRERAIIENRLLSDNPKTLEEIGKEFGVSREYVRQVEVRVKEKLAKILKSRGLKLEDSQ